MEEKMQEMAKERAEKGEEEGEALEGYHLLDGHASYGERQVAALGLVDVI